MNSARRVRGVRQEALGVRTYRLTPKASRLKGFTLIEAMAGVVLMGIGIVGATAAFGSLIRTEDSMRQTEKMSRMAQDKFSELVATGQAETSSDGDFTDQNEPGYTWSLQTDTSGIADLDSVTLTVKHTDSGQEARLDSMIYIPPETATGATQ